MTIRHSMSALRAFDAVARHLSFSRAAAELGISQSAISRHVAALEVDLACRLVARTTRHCALTDEGRRLYEGLARGLRSIEEALTEARRRGGRLALNVSVSPFLSVAWFTPRLLDFIARNPDIEVTLTHAYEPPHFAGEGIDLGINWGRRPSDRRIRAERLLPGDLVPVCTAAYAAAHLDPGDPASLLSCTLFHEFRTSDWAAWFEAAGVPGSAPRSQQISDSGALRKAALSGRGVALLFAALLQDDLASGALIQPYAAAVNCGEDYWVSWPARHAERLAVRRFLRWLRTQRPPRDE